jgi:small-conductance mechanosensitive channel
MDKKQAISDRLAKNLPTKHKKTNQDYIDKKDIKDDYEFSRATLKDLIKVGTYSMDSLAELARESEHPRAFEVLSNHLKAIGDITDKLMKLQKNKKELTEDDVRKEITNNNVFVGSTTDLQRMLLDKDNIIDVETEDKE